MNMPVTVESEWSASGESCFAPRNIRQIEMINGYNRIAYVLIHVLVYSKSDNNRRISCLRQCMEISELKRSLRLSLFLHYIICISVYLCVDR